MTVLPYAFSASQKLEVAKILKRYPAKYKQSAVMPILWLLQRDNKGWLTQGMIEAVAHVLGMQPLRVQELVSFYALYQDSPVGKHHIQVCRTLSCKLRGAGALYQACRTQLGLTDGELSEDGRFSLTRVECLGCCANAPVVQINEDIHEDLTAESFVKILKALQEDKTVIPGSACGRKSSKPWTDKVSGRQPRKVSSNDT
ncbi:MAG: NAD(P)H-dependent oxidoreductase subunit E [Alphaproteobacteria bacterium]|nr:MAG: NAD(P)H-dependent oxidoreductase subunit E [Alphaproteobacteria bacterium]